MLNTETPSTRHPDLDRYPVDELVAALIDDQAGAVSAVLAAQSSIARAVTAAVLRLRAGGRLIYVGAGTSGRLGVLDSSELHPTFSWPTERSVALIAGGERAVFEALEGAEDSATQGSDDVRALPVWPNDAVILIAASGATPYVMGALAAVREIGALSIGMANNPDAPVIVEAEIGILLDTGSELISGSTRLKAGTAQKIALNTLSSAIMVRLNKVFGNLMVDLMPTNAKLFRRAVDLTVRATGCSDAVALSTLEACDYRIKVAVVAILNRSSVDAAITRLEASDGNVRLASSALP